MCTSVALGRVCREHFPSDRTFTQLTSRNLSLPHQTPQTTHSVKPCSSYFFRLRLFATLTSFSSYYSPGPSLQYHSSPQL